VVLCVGLGVGHEGTTDARTLMVWIDSDVLDQQVIWRDGEDNESRTAGVVGDEDLT